MTADDNDIEVRLRQQSWCGPLHTEAADEIKWLRAAREMMQLDAEKYRAEAERLRALTTLKSDGEIEQRGNDHIDWWAVSVKQRREIKRLQAAIAFVRARSARAGELLNEFDNTYALIADQRAET